MEAATQDAESCPSSSSAATQVDLTRQASNSLDIVSRCVSINGLLRLDRSSMLSSCPEDQTVRNCQDLQWCDRCFSPTSSNGVVDSISDSLAGSADPPSVCILESTQQVQLEFDSNKPMQRSSSNQGHDSTPGRDNASMMISKGFPRAAPVHQATRPAASSRSTRSTSTESEPTKDIPASHKQHLISGRQHSSPWRVVSLPVLPHSSTAAPVSPLGTYHYGRFEQVHNNPGL